MSAANVPVVPPAKVNGAPAPHPSGAPRKRSVSKPPVAISEVSGPDELASFVGLEIPGIDAQMWPVHPILWLQPELNPEPPDSSGLRIERQQKLPIPGFLDLETGTGNQAGAILELRRRHASNAPSELPPAVPCMLPQSDLAPLGWDPRASLDQSGKKGRP